MVIKILGNCESEAFKAAEMFVKAKGHTLWCEGYRCDLAIAPLLTVKVSDEELKEANWGTLIFHPHYLMGAGHHLSNGRINEGNR